jgi:integrase/recombinase XerD
MTGEPMSPLRRRMIEDMAVRSFNPHTQRDYIRAVSKLATFLGRSPGTASAEDLRRFQIHLRQTGVLGRPSIPRSRRCGSSAASRSTSRRWRDISP